MSDGGVPYESYSSIEDGMMEVMEVDEDVGDDSDFGDGEYTILRISLNSILCSSAFMCP